MRTGYVEDQPGFSQKRQEEILAAAGFTPSRICGKGHTCATLAEALKLIRGAEVLETAGGFRPLGSSRKTIMEQYAVIKKAGKVVLDVETGERSDRDSAEMLDRALAKIRYEKTMPSPEHAKEIGRAGGKAKGRNAAAARMAENSARRIWLNKSIATNAEAIDKMTGWSRESAYRKFGPSRRPPGRAGS